MISKKYVVGALGILTTLSIGATVQADDTTGVVEYTSGGIVFDPDKGGSDPNTQLPTNLDFGAHEIQTENGGNNGWNWITWGWIHATKRSSCSQR